MKRIRIVRKQQVWHIAPDQLLDFLQHGHRMRTIALAPRHVIALIIDAQQIEAGSVVLDDRARGAQQPHTFFAEEPFRVIFHSRINFVVAIASPDAERSAQAAQLGDTNVQRIAFAREMKSPVAKEMSGCRPFAISTARAISRGGM